MNHFNPPTLSPLSLDLLTGEAPTQAADAAFRRAQKAATDERPWLARLPFTPAVVRLVCIALLRLQAAQRLWFRWSERIPWILIALAGLAGGTYVACSGPAPSERYVVGPDPEMPLVPQAPKPEPTAYASRGEDAGFNDAAAT